MQQPKLGEPKDTPRNPACIFIRSWAFVSAFLRGLLARVTIGLPMSLALALGALGLHRILLRFTLSVALDVLRGA